LEASDEINGGSWWQVLKTVEKPIGRRPQSQISPSLKSDFGSVCFNIKCFLLENFGEIILFSCENIHFQGKLLISRCLASMENHKFFYIIVFSKNIYQVLNNLNQVSITNQVLN
jgi:hypothetical protein